MGRQKLSDKKAKKRALKSHFKKYQIDVREKLKFYLEGGGVQKTPFCFSIRLVHFLAFFAAGDATALLAFPVALLVVFALTVFNDFGPFFLGVVFLKLGAFFAAGFFVGAVSFSPAFLVAVAGVALRGFAAAAAFGTLADFVSGRPGLGALTGLAAAPIALEFPITASFLTALISLLTLIAGMDLGALTGFFKSSDSLKEFLTLYTLPCLVMLRSWTDKIFLKLGGNPLLYISSRYLAIAY
jgi:hypothetical protein